MPRQYLGPTGTNDQPKGERTRLIGAIVLVALLLAFVFDNRHSVRVGFVFTDKRVPLIAVLVVTAVIGAIIDRLLLWRHRRSKQPPADGSQ